MEAVGGTPLVQLSRLFRHARVFAKLELLNPGGSAKDRPALRMIQQAWDEGRLVRGSVVIEFSSGNMAISLAMICRQLDMRLICVVDPKTTESNMRILRALGADIELVTEPDAATGEFLPARLSRVAELCAKFPGSFWPNQYANEANYLSHCDTTMAEIVRQLDRVDGVVCAVSTCGTVRGCAEYVRRHRLTTRVIAVDAEGSAVFGGDRNKRRLFPGIGAGIVPPFCEPQSIDRIIHVSDREMVAGCHALAREEGILAGASSGAVIAAMKRLEPELDTGSVFAVILHDRGERYLDTVYNDEWVQTQFTAEGEQGAIFE